MCDDRILRSARLIDRGGGRLRPAGGLPVPHRRDGEERVGARSSGSRLVYRQWGCGHRGGRAGSVGGRRVRCVSASRPVCAHERSGGRRRRRRAPGLVGARRGVRPVSTWSSAIRLMCRTILTSPSAPIPSTIGSARAWDAGHDGRLVLDPLSAAVPDLLAPGGTFLVVQSEFAVPRQNTGDVGRRRTGRGSRCIPVDSVRTRAVVAGGVAGGHRPAGTRSA